MTKAKTPPSNQRLKGGQPHSTRSYVKMCVHVCLCVCVCVGAHMSRNVPNVMVSICLCVIPPRTLVSVTCQMCVHVFVLAFF